MRPVGAYWGHFAAKRPEISTNGSTRSESSASRPVRAFHSRKYDIVMSGVSMSLERAKVAGFTHALVIDVPS
jgi:hypothetical protein